MATGTWIGNSKLFGEPRPYEVECVTAHELPFDRLLDLRHVARRALAACAGLGMMRVFTDRSVQPCWIVLGMAAQA